MPSLMITIQRTASRCTLILDLSVARFCFVHRSWTTLPKDGVWLSLVDTPRCFAAVYFMDFIAFQNTVMALKISKMGRKVGRKTLLVPPEMSSLLQLGSFPCITTLRCSSRHRKFPFYLFLVSSDSFKVNSRFAQFNRVWRTFCFRRGLKSSATCLTPIICIV